MTNKAMNTLKAIVESGELEPNRELGIGAAQHYLASKQRAYDIGDTVNNGLLMFVVAGGCVTAVTVAHIVLQWALGAF